MRSRAFRAMGSAWWIACDQPLLLAEAEALVHAHEAELSRFRADSAVTRLDRERRARSPTLAAVTRLALALRDATDGAFDPTLGAALAALGYDRSFERLRIRTTASRPAPRADGVTRVGVDGDEVRLDGPGALDLGGIAKGYTVDRVVAHLVARGAGAVLVDGGGDLRGAGRSFAIGVGPGLAVETRCGAVATSSTRSRRWRTIDAESRGREHHHILDPRTGRSSDSSVDVATIVAPDAATADALATAAIAAPDAVVPRLRGFGAHALLRARDGRWWSSADAPWSGDGDPDATVTR
ncbi:MAG: FAD:protein FMN transferase [Myxococcota bacterium]